MKSAIRIEPMREGDWAAVRAIYVVTGRRRDVVLLERRSSEVGAE